MVRPTPWYCDLFHAMLTNLYGATGTERCILIKWIKFFNQNIQDLYLIVDSHSLYTNNSAWHIDVTSKASRVCLSAWWCTNHNHSVLLFHCKISHNDFCINVCDSWKPGLEWCCPNFLSILLKCRLSGPWSNTVVSRIQCMYLLGLNHSNVLTIVNLCICALWAV